MESEFYPDVLTISVRISPAGDVTIISGDEEVDEAETPELYWLLRWHPEVEAVLEKSPAYRRLQEETKEEREN